MKPENNLKVRMIRFSVSVMKLAHIHAREQVLVPVFQQVIRSSGSVGANVTEAHGSITKAGFVRYFHIALQSANETKYWLEVILAYGLKEREVLLNLIREVEEFIKIITASLRTMKSRP